MENISNLFWGKSKYWWTVLLPGVLLIPCGCWFLFSPSIGYFTITTVLLWMLILVGIVQLINAFNMQRHHTGWGWWVAGGIIDIFIGFIMLGNIGFSAMVLPYFFAFIFLYKGVASVVSAFSSIGHNSSWWLYLINGLLQIILAALFFVSPFSAMIAIDFLIGVSFIYWGISLIFLSLDLRPGNRQPALTTEEEV